ncbi:DUF1876 domain-containing protein [Actinoallomurus purpureus]|uniref:DUF1876 domain-containing protein n=1 Tax=Actinoallomurus purpureus TaxID=478114 RepID=UPI002092774D|nr:DUF1876 domain-containing protein [Actinoallomurus purpureus]MCO6010615.1 DUF1876 domain-containing protein [Actinoallomurus purpureus]
MRTEDRWSVEVYLDEHDGETHAEARLVAGDAERVRGRGRARCNPADWDVPRIGAELATSRALSDLAHRLLDLAAADIEGVTHEHVTLIR